MKKERLKQEDTVIIFKTYRRCKIDLQICKGETVILLVTPLDTRGQGWLLSEDIKQVILTLRETEDAEALLVLYGTVETIGESVDNPGKLAVLIHTEDTKDLPVGEYWYDVTIIKTGHWFDIAEDELDSVNEYAGLYLPIGYGKIKDVADEWLEVESGWLELTDNATNYVSIDKSGNYHVRTDDYEADTYPLYNVITLDNFIVSEFPWNTWFEYDEYFSLGLDFVYKEGKYVDANYQLQDKNSGYVTLKPAATNYIEIDTSGNITSNITRFSSDKYPLYKVVTDNTGIESVEVQSSGLILDGRGKFVRGDSYIPSVKAKASIIWTPTKAEE
jgi:hypothetical protein